MPTFPPAWDGEALVLRHDAPTGAWIAIAIHSTRLGPAVGGARLRVYPDPWSAVADAERLAEGMTLKFAVQGMPWGGGKAVITPPAPLAPEARAGLLRRYGALLASLGGLYRTAPDVGTSSEDMDVIAETAGALAFGRTPAAGGAGSSGPATAVGVLAAIGAVCERLFGDAAPRGRRVLVQGAGSVGGALLGLLRAAGAEPLFSDVEPATIARWRDREGVPFVEPAAVPETPCDVYAPCALGGALAADTIARLACRAVAGGANNQLASPADAEAMRARGILYAPDFVANVGGAMAGLLMEADGWSRARAEAEVAARVRETLRRVFDIADAEGVTTDEAARRLAAARLAAARPRG
uniref:Glu/Leu/Phe/Val dehydrogenase n=1 Tax=Eiseniibacteriota bacterium TaxID=2212470 RepID=A0A832I5B7_UNCEI